VKDVLNADHKINESTVLRKEQTKMGQANRIFFINSVRKQLKAYFDEHQQLQDQSERPLFITKNVSVRVLMGLAGHSQTATIQRYIDLRPSVVGAAVELV
jgi:hypothetical protein